MLEKNSSRPDIDCPGDIISYNCTVESNTEALHLTWTVTFLDFTTISITYNSTSELNQINNLDMNITSTLISVTDEHLESLLMLTLVKDVDMDGILVECSIRDIFLDTNLDNNSVFVEVNTSGMCVLLVYFIL